MDFLDAGDFDFLLAHRSNVALETVDELVPDPHGRRRSLENFTQASSDTHGVTVPERRSGPAFR